MRIPITDGVIDLEEACVVRGTTSHGLTPIEERLLRHLARDGGLCSREELLTEVWDYRPGVQSRTIDNTVRRLREKIEVDPSQPSHLQTVYGRGVRLVWNRTGATLVGRAEVTQDLLQRLGGPGRLFTAIGPPGVGKSTVARHVAGQWAGSVVTVELESCAPAQVVHRIGTALGMQPVDSTRFAAALRARGPVVVLLDGVDGLAATLGPLIATWLDGTEAVVVLATARGPLGLPGETVVAIDALGEEDAEELYRRCRGGGDDDHAAVRSLLRLLDGLPLAIELAARRAALVAPADLCTRIQGGRRLQDLLGGGLQATLATCLSDLAPGDVVSLRDLTTFRSPFRLEDAEALLGEADALDALERLVEQGLVRVLPGERPSYAVYRVIRDHVQASHPVPEEVWRRHGDWFGRLGAFVPGATRLQAQRAATLDCEAAMTRLWNTAPTVAGRCGLAVLTVLAVDGPPGDALALAQRLTQLVLPDPLRAVLHRHTADMHLAQAHIPEALSEIASGLALSLPPDERAHLLMSRVQAYKGSGRFSDAQADLDLLFASADALSPAVRARVQMHAGYLDLVRGRWSQAEAHLLRAREWAVANGDPLLDSRCASGLAYVVWFDGRLAEAASLCREALRHPGSRTEAAWISFELAQIELDRGCFDEASEALEASETVFEASGALPEQLMVGGLRATLLARTGRPEAAEALLLSVLNRAPPHASQAFTWARLTEIRLQLRHLDEARQALDKASSLASVSGVRSTEATLTVWRATLLALEGDLDGARREVASMASSGRLEHVRKLALGAYVEATCGDRHAAGELIARARVELGSLGLGTTSEMATWLQKASTELKRLRLA